MIQDLPYEFMVDKLILDLLRIPVISKSEYLVKKN